METNYFFDFRRISWDLLEEHLRAHNRRRKANATNDHGTKGHIAAC